MQQNILFFPDIQIFYLRTQSAHNNGSILVPYQFMPAVLGRYFWSWSNSGPRFVGKCFDFCWPAGLLPVFLILVQPKPKIAGQRVDLCWPACPTPVFLILVRPQPMYRFILAGLSFAVISDLGPTVAKYWLANVLIYFDRPMYRSMLAGLSFAVISDLGPTVAKDWLANVLIYFNRPMYRSMLAGLFSTSISDLGPTAAQDCRPAMSVSTYVGKPV